MRHSVSALVAGLALSVPHVVLGAEQGKAGKLNEFPEKIKGFHGPIPFGNATINAPLDENGRETYIGMSPTAAKGFFVADFVCA